MFSIKIYIGLSSFPRVMQPCAPSQQSDACNEVREMALIDML